MKNPTAKILSALILLGLIAAAVRVFQPSPLQVESAVLERGPFMVTVQDQGRTRATNPYVIAAPLTGAVLRTDFNEGDRVTQGDVLARIALPPENQRIRATMQADLEAAEARRAAAEAALDEAESAYEVAIEETKRREELYTNNLASAEELRTFQQRSTAARARLASTRATLDASEAEVRSARSRLIGVEPDGVSGTEIVRAPVSGTIYRIHEENERIVQAGTPLYSISNDDHLEIVIDLLTQDAVKVAPGDTILIEGWGGDEILTGLVRYIEPEAFTKISALGVEEQRVNVVGELIDRPQTIGAEYRIEASIIIWEEENVLTIPNSAIFQRRDGWNSFVIEEDTVNQRLLEIGYRGRDNSQIISGIDAGERVVLFPSDLIEEGIEVTY
ncbi:MAG: efflux RND transporter periplasmic adaptor subunit [Pseudohongiellaceae bacterium]